MSNFHNIKTLLYQSKIVAQNVHIGDVYNINGILQKIPLRLNILPFIDKADVIGRDSDLEKVHQLLQTSDKVVLVNGLGGIGKTTLAKYFVAHFREHFRYVAWVNVTSNIKEAFLNDTALVDSLHLKTELEAMPQNEKWIDSAFSLIINRMRQLGSPSSDYKNLLIIDNAGEDIEHTQTLDQIALRPNWKVLVTSREKLIGFTEYELGFLSPEDAKLLFYRHYKREKEDDLVEEVLEIIDYHTLLIEIVSKTAQSLRLDLRGLLHRLKKKGLNISEEAKIKFRHNYNQKIFNVLEYLLEMFKVADLGEDEKWLMMQFAVLPSLYIPYNPKQKDSILQLLQVQQDEKKDKITKNINRIVEKGWLQWDENADTFKMHNVIQEVLRFKLNPDVDNCRDLIQELFARMSYQHVDLVSNNNIMVKSATQYILGASIDFAELLDEYASVVQRFYDFPESIRLQARSLKMKKQVLPKNHIKLADSYNSLALSYLNLGDFDQALGHQLKDLEITQLNSSQEDYNLAISYNNLSLIYRKMKDLDQAIYYQKEGARIADIIRDPDLDNVVYNNIGNLEYQQKNFDSALTFFKKSLEVRLANNSDALWISEAHYNLGTAYIEVSHFEKAKFHLDEAFQIEKDLVADKSSFAAIHHGYGLLYYEQQGYEKSLFHFKQSLSIFRLNFEEGHFEVERGRKWVEKLTKMLHLE